MPATACYYLILPLLGSALETSELYKGKIQSYNLNHFAKFTSFTSVKSSVKTTSQSTSQSTWGAAVVKLLLMSAAAMRNCCTAAVLPPQLMHDYEFIGAVFAAGHSQALIRALGSMDAESTGAGESGGGGGGPWAAWMLTAGESCICVCVCVCVCVRACVRAQGAGWAT